MAGLYIHIPFCASRCIYCGFYSTTHQELQERYVNALCREMRLRPAPHEVIETIYLGGGTPSQLSFGRLSRLLSYIYKVYEVSPSAEVTIECNPDDVCHEDFALPPVVNRVSMGVQTFSDAQLQFLHRRHSSRQVWDAIAKLRRAGIHNISIDLMFGFPDETLIQWQNDLQQALRLQVEHISAYSLMYEEGTPLFRMLEEGHVRETDEELMRSMYETLVDTLTHAGYEHYEISNFALPGKRSRHNSSYWQDKPYMGLGAAAHSYNLHQRQWNVSNLHAYLQAIEGGKVPFEAEPIDEATHYNDLVTTALRTCEGMNLQQLSAPYHDYLLAQAQPFIEQGTLAHTGNRLHLTPQGIFISDTIMAALVYV